MRADVSDIDGWWDRISPQVQEEILTGATALGRMARAYLQQHALLNGVRLSPVVVAPVAAQIAESLRVTGPVAFKVNIARTGSETAAVRAMATQLQGAASRLVLEGDRQTTMRTFQERDGMAGWRRIAGGGKTCAFCRMLIGRGAVYRKDTARFESHGHCSCSAEPLYQREPEPPEVRRLQQQWREATAGTSGKAAIAAWRQFVAKQDAGSS